MGIFAKAGSRMPSWHGQMLENQQRWMVFLGKLEAKMQELCEAAIPELRQVYQEDADLYKRAHGQMLAGVRGQLNVMLQKVHDVAEEKIHGFLDEHDDDAGDSGLDSFAIHDLLFEFRNTCLERERAFEARYHAWCEQLEHTAQRDLEGEYQQILNEYAAIKDRFTCQQCGGPISIEKIYFLSTYLTCPHCQTRNTFEPSSQARRLEDLGRSLAEQRAAPLLLAYQTEQQRERDLYFQIHELQLRLDDDAPTYKADAAKIAELEQARRDAIARAPALYETYLRAMFDEWHQIVPDLREQNEKFYQRLLEDFRRSL